MKSEMGGTNKRIAANLVYLRHWRGYSQEAVAEALGITRVMYAFYETGRNQPSMDRLDEIAKLYGITVGMIIHRDMSGHHFSPLMLSDYDDIEEKLEKFKALSFISRRLVMERIRTLLEVETSLYERLR